MKVKLINHDGRKLSVKCKKAEELGENVRGYLAHSVSIGVKLRSKEQVDNLIRNLQIVRECFP